MFAVAVQPAHEQEHEQAREPRAQRMPLDGREPGVAREQLLTPGEAKQHQAEPMQRRVSDDQRRSAPTDQQELQYERHVRPAAAQPNCQPDQRFSE